MQQHCSAYPIALLSSPPLYPTLPLPLAILIHAVLTSVPHPYPFYQLLHPQVPMVLAQRLQPMLDRVAKKAGATAGCATAKDNIHPKFSCDSWSNQIDFLLRGSEGHAQALQHVAQASGIDVGVSLDRLMEMLYTEARLVMGSNPLGSLALAHFPESRGGALSAPLLKEAKSIAGYDSCEPHCNSNVTQRVSPRRQWISPRTH